jgi:hypothetical protein
MKLTPRGEAFMAFSLVVLIMVLLYAGYQVINHIWYVQGEGYCWGTMTECLKTGEYNG